MIKNCFTGIEKSALLLLLVLCAGMLLGCNSKKTLSLYQEKYETAVRLLGEDKYDEAKEAFTALILDVENEANQTDKLTEMKADAEYALGYIALSEAEYYVSYDYYTSAYVYYKSIFQENGEKTLDARLKLAELETINLGRKEHALGEYIEIYEMTQNFKYKNVALCNMTALYTSMDNGAKAEEKIVLVNDLIDQLTEEDLEKIRQETANNNEKGNLDRLVGRIEEVDQYLEAYETIGNYYIAIDDPEKAVETYEEALKFISENDIGTTPFQIGYLESLGFLKLYYYGISDGNTYLQQADELIENSVAAGIERASHYIQMAEIYLALGDYEMFAQYMKNAESLIREKKGENDSLIALCEIRMSFYYRRIGEYQLAVENCEKAVEIKKNLLDEDGTSIATVYNNLANCYAEAGKKEEAVEAYKKAREIYLKYDDKLQLAVVDRNLALVCNNSLYNHTLALQYANEAIEIVDTMDPSFFGKTIASIYMVMPDILDYSDKEYVLIEDYSQKAYECLQNAVGNTDEETAYYHNNLAIYLIEKARYKEALNHLLAAEDLFKQVYVEEKLYPIDIYFDIARCYYMNNQYDYALAYFKKSVKYDEDHIEVLIGQGNYRTSYWQEKRDKSKWFINYIEEYHNENYNPD